MRAGVALAAGLDDILTRKVGLRIPDRQHVMSAMAVITFGRRSIAQFRNLAMKSLKISLSDILMAPSALVDDVELETLLVGAGYSVGGMAVVADGEFFISLSFSGIVNALSKLLINAVMAFCAGLGDVMAIDAGGGIAAGEFMMGGMAVGAHGGDYQTAF